MSFLNPWGLLGLIGIPVLILIYILKPKFEEKEVSSTFIWKLSLKYRRKHLPMQWLRQSLLFFLQLMIIVSTSLVLARPVVAVDSPGREMIVIIDASGSMQAVSDGESCFDRALAAADKLAGSMASDSKMSVIYAGDYTSAVLLRSDSPRAIQKALSALTCTYTEADINGALALAEPILAQNPQAGIILYTDKDYEETGDISVINLADSEWNAAALALDATLAEDNTYVFVSEVASYGADAKLTLALYIDNALVGAKIVDCTAGESVNVFWKDLDIATFKQAKVFIEAGDALDEDNVCYLSGEDSEASEVLIVSKTPMFLKAILKQLGIYNITVAESLDAAELSGYDLYIFDGITPDSLPGDGAVWLINPSAAPAGTGLTLGSTVEGTFYLSAAENTGTDTYTLLTQYLAPEKIAVSSFTEALSYDSYEAILKCNDTPLLLAGEANSTRVVALMFDIHNSNLPLLVDFPELIFNMAAYSLPPVLADDVYTVGDTVDINAVSGAQLITVKDGSDQSLMYMEFPVSFTADVPGLSTVKQTLASGAAVSCAYFVQLSPTESNIAAAGGKLLASADLEMTADKAADETGVAVTYTKEIWFYLAALLLLLLVAEWGVHYRELF